MRSPRPFIRIPHSAKAYAKPCLPQRAVPFISRPRNRWHPHDSCCANVLLLSVLCSAKHTQQQNVCTTVTVGPFKKEGTIMVVGDVTTAVDVLVLGAGP